MRYPYGGLNPTPLRSARSFDMNITSAQYKARHTYDENNEIISTRNCAVIAVIDGKKLGVPLDPANSEYAAILEWVAEGNTITAAK